MITKDYVHAKSEQHRSQIVNRFNHQISSPVVRQHSLEVANLAWSLGVYFGLDRSVCYTMGLVHDIAKPDCKTFQDACWFLKTHRIFVKLDRTDSERWHELVGALYAKTLMGIDNQDILSAIRSHSSFFGIKNSPNHDYSKVLIIADKLCNGRGDYKKNKVHDSKKTLSEIRNAKSLNDGFVILLKDLMSYRMSNNKSISQYWITTYNACIQKEEITNDTRT